MSRLPPPRVTDPPFAERPRPRTWAAVLRLAFDGDFAVPLGPAAQTKWIAAKRGAVDAILDRLGVDARVCRMYLDIPEPIHPLIPPGPPEMVVGFARHNGIVIEDIRANDAMPAKPST